MHGSQANTPLNPPQTTLAGPTYGSARRDRAPKQETPYTHERCTWWPSLSPQDPLRFLKTGSDRSEKAVLLKVQVRAPVLIRVSDKPDWDSDSTLAVRLFCPYTLIEP